MYHTFYIYTGIRIEWMVEIKKYVKYFWTFCTWTSEGVNLYFQDCKSNGMLRVCDTSSLQKDVGSRRGKYLQEERVDSDKSCLILQNKLESPKPALTQQNFQFNHKKPLNYKGKCSCDHTWTWLDVHKNYIGQRPCAFVY